MCCAVAVYLVRPHDQAVVGVALNAAQSVLIVLMVVPAKVFSHVNQAIHNMLNLLFVTAVLFPVDRPCSG